MAKDFELLVSANELSKLVDGTISIQHFLDTLFTDKNTYTTFSQSLASYYYDHSGSPEVREFTVTDTNFNKQTLTGSFKCSFKVYYFFTCSDIKNDKNEYLTWTFKIDNQTNKITFAGEEPWVIDN
jgi:hypothetical protein